MIRAVLGAVAKVGEVASLVSVASKWAPEVRRIVESAIDAAAHPSKDGIRQVLSDVADVVQKDREAFRARAARLREQALSRIERDSH